MVVECQIRAYDEPPDQKTVRSWKFTTHAYEPMKETDEVVQPIEEDVKTVLNPTVNTNSIPVSVHLVRQGQSANQNHTHTRIERVVEDSELPLVQCEFLTDIAGTDGVTVQSMHAKTFGYDISTVVETMLVTRSQCRGQTNVEHHRTLLHHHALWSWSVTHQVGRRR